MRTSGLVRALPASVREADRVAGQPGECSRLQASNPFWRTFRLSVYTLVIPLFLLPAFGSHSETNHQGSHFPLIVSPPH